MQNFSCKTYTTKVITQCVVAAYHVEIINLRRPPKFNKARLPKGGAHERK